MLGNTAFRPRYSANKHHQTQQKAQRPLPPYPLRREPDVSLFQRHADAHAYQGTHRGRRTFGGMDQEQRQRHDEGQRNLRAQPAASQPPARRRDEPQTEKDQQRTDCPAAQHGHRMVHAQVDARQADQEGDDESHDPRPALAHLGGQIAPYHGSALRVPTGKAIGDWFFQGDQLAHLVRCTYERSRYFEQVLEVLIEVAGEQEEDGETCTYALIEAPVEQRGQDKIELLVTQEGNGPEQCVEKRVTEGLQPHVKFDERGEELLHFITSWPRVVSLFRVAASLPSQSTKSLQRFIVFPAVSAVQQ